MSYYLKRYWAELLVFGAVFGVLLMCNLPAMTWINTDSDGAHYILSAKYMQVAHNMSQPLFLLLGRLFLYLPLGTEAWRMGLISVLATTGCTVLIYKVIRWHLADNPRVKFYALTASLIYGGSALVISQSTIIETYALATMLSVWAYYMSLQKRWLFTSILLGVGLAVHSGLTAFCWIVLFIANKEMRHWKWVLTTGSFLSFYLYIPIVGLLGNSLSMWGNETLEGFTKNNAGTMMMLAGGLAILDLPKRILNTIGILGVSLGLGFIIIIWHYIRLKTLRNSLLWLMLIPILYYGANLAPETYVYLLPAIAYGAIVVGIGVSKLHIRWGYAVLFVALALMAFNANYFDIGRTLDPNLSAQRFYDEELPKIKDGEIYLGGGWTWAIVYLYNKEENRNIIPICTDILPSQEYLAMVEAKGINLVRTDSESPVDKQWLVAKSIAVNNPNVWIARETVPSEFQYEIVPAKGNMDLIERWLGYEKTPTMSWKPSNPYHYITGALEVSDWKFILMSNHNCRLVFSFGTFSLFIYWLILRAFGKRKKGIKNEVLPKIEAKTES